MTYRVLIDDNFHFMNEDERCTHGEFESLAEAIAACKKIVDDCLNGEWCAQWIDATHSLNRSAGVWKSSVFLGRSLS
jgi:hypothetical protein